MVDMVWALMKNIEMHPSADMTAEVAGLKCLAHISTNSGKG
jgi:hypothetical protein